MQNSRSCPGLQTVWEHVRISEDYKFPSIDRYIYIVSWNLIWNLNMIHEKGYAVMQAAARTKCCTNPWPVTRTIVSPSASSGAAEPGAGDRSSSSRVINCSSFVVLLSWVQSLVTGHNEPLVTQPVQAQHWHQPFTEQSPTPLPSMGWVRRKILLCLP